MRYKNLALYVLIGVMAFSIGIFLTGCATTDDGGGGGSESVSPTGDIPTVSNTDPANAAVEVAINRKINATFSKEMRSATITRTTFTLENTTLGGTSVIGTVDYIGTTATFTPLTDLAVSTIYTATITTGAEDPEGNALESNYVWSFTTGASTDTTAPTVIRTNPVDEAINVAVNRKINATFSEAMNPTTITRTTFTLENTTLGGTSVTGTVVYAGITATFTPSDNLDISTLYTATVTTGAEDLAGNVLASNYVWSFTTGAEADTTAPTVILTDPGDNATDVTINSTVNAVFSEEMTPTTVTTATFTLENTTLGGISVTGAVVYIGTTAIFTPNTALAASTLYTATVTTGAKDLAGNALASNYIWSFTTGTTTAAGPAPVILGTAGNFVILSKSGISSVPNSIITGNIGVSPIDSTAVTGFSLSMDSSNTFSTSTQVTGNVYAADYTEPTPSNLTTAVSDMETAAVDAAGRAIPTATELGAGNITLMTLAPGLYKWGTDLNIDAAGVTLEGGANDVWIFQVSGNFIVANAAIITLSGGAQPKNIFWQVTGQTTLGTTSNFKGIILCDTLIEMQTGASLTGRMLAQTAVTLDQATVTRP